MTDDEKKKLCEGFRKPVENQTEEIIEDDPWTEEAILEVAKKILKRINSSERPLL